MAKKEDGVEIKVERDGTRLWYLHGVLHRDNGPAVERPEGDYRWYQFGKEHREDGPAIERPNGTKEWFRNGKHHREDGPAVEYGDGRKEYCLNGEKWDDGASIIARRKAEKSLPKKKLLCPCPFKKP